MIKQIELRLVGGSAPSGEITLKDLSAISAALQELVTRLSRDAADAAGPGRSKQYVEEFAELRLGAIQQGSTVLQFSKGPTDKLDVEVPGLADADDRFWEVLTAISTDHRPDWVSELIAESAGKLTLAMRAAADTVVVASPSRGTFVSRPQTPIPRLGQRPDRLLVAPALRLGGSRRWTCIPTSSDSATTSATQSNCAASPMTQLLRGSSDNGFMPRAWQCSVRLDG